MDARITNSGTVIVIDDDVALLRALRFSLELEGYNVEVHRGDEALDPNTLPKERTCLVIDYLLPGRTGLQVLETLRARGVDLPAVIITTHAGRVVRSVAEDLNAVVVEKPLLGPELSSEIQAQLSRHARKYKEAKLAMTDPSPRLSRIILELAREPERPEGDAQERYVLVAPLTSDAHIDGEAWKMVKERCRVARESAGGKALLGTSSMSPAVAGPCTTTLPMIAMTRPGSASTPNASSRENMCPSSVITEPTSSGLSSSNPSTASLRTHPG